MRQSPKIVLAILCLLAAFIPFSHANAAQVSIKGEVTYRERIALPPGGRLVVSLVDTSAKGNPVRVKAEAAIVGPGQVPLQFHLDFEDAVIAPKHTYGLIAEIRAEDTLWFSNATPFPVDPLAPEVPLIILINFVGQQIATPPAKPAIFDTIWRVTSIGAAAVKPDFKATLSVAEDGRAGGNGGCNNFFAQSRVEDPKLDFSAIASTRMACAPAEMSTESNYFAALETVTGFSITEDTLTLTDEAGKTSVVLTKAVEK
jgi:putative lipoprotein